MNSIESRFNQHLFLATVFAGGMTVLAIELSAVRLLGSVLGVSNVVWASIIGLVLICLSAGYYVGGRWADRSPTLTRFYQIAAWGAFIGALPPVIARVVLPVVSGLDISLPVAASVAVGLLFSVPMVLLGCISPFAIKLSLTDVDIAGRLSGRLFAVSTLGGVVGSLGPVLYVLPSLGTRVSFLLFTDLLLAVSLLGLSTCGRHHIRKFLWMAAVHLVLWVALLIS
jgi:predicted membrane-bound spermidine synthase